MQQHLLLLLALLLSFASTAQNTMNPIIRGFCIAAPQPDRLDDFVKFIDEELAPRGVNTLVLRVDFNYQYESRPELRDSTALSKEDVRKLVDMCRQHDIDIVPQVNLLGHQSWAGELGNLLQRYPEFDETPHVEMPENYEWPNEDGLYCKSYCPLHPEVHEVVFDLVDEIMEVFEAKAFHAGMDEVFYIGDERCPRCGGRDKAELFAGEVRTIRDHLARRNQDLWIWGDRLLDGKTTGLGMWEASMNNTHRAIDLIPKDVVICDWHYERPDPTAAYFAMKGFQVITCPWNKPEVALQQYEQFIDFKKTAHPQLADRYLGMMQTIWTGADNFLDQYYGEKEPDENRRGTIDSFTQLFDAMK